MLQMLLKLLTDKLGLILVMNKFVEDRTHYDYIFISPIITLKKNMIKEKMW